ncbi:hypothetical protein GW17_00049170 [Ensete ventricosum]|nr:hypothetical protein GW17_00049170 [Ensete ventricosum]
MRKSWNGCRVLRKGCNDGAPYGPACSGSRAPRRRPTPPPSSPSSMAVPDSSTSSTPAPNTSALPYSGRCCLRLVAGSLTRYIARWVCFSPVAGSCARWPSRRCSKGRPSSRSPPTLPLPLFRLSRPTTSAMCPRTSAPVTCPGTSTRSPARRRITARTGARSRR